MSTTNTTLPGHVVRPIPSPPSFTKNLLAAIHNMSPLARITVAIMMIDLITTSVVATIGVFQSASRVPYPFLVMCIEFVVFVVMCAVYATVTENSFLLGTLWVTVGAQAAYMTLDYFHNIIHYSVEIKLVLLIFNWVCFSVIGVLSYAVAKSFGFRLAKKFGVFVHQVRQGRSYQRYVAIVCVDWCLTANAFSLALMLIGNDWITCTVLGSGLGIHVLCGYPMLSLLRLMESRAKFHFILLAHIVVLGVLTFFTSVHIFHMSQKVDILRTKAEQSLPGASFMLIGSEILSTSSHIIALLVAGYHYLTRSDMEGFFTSGEGFVGVGAVVGPSSSRSVRDSLIPNVPPPLVVTSLRSRESISGGGGGGGYVISKQDVEDVKYRSVGSYDSYSARSQSSSHRHQVMIFSGIEEGSPLSN
eukprot:PhF_6_TR36021/c0_g1_i1/m.52216